jgi:RluA family pseudouridine synthase
MKTFQCKVTREADGQRLDVFLVEAGLPLSRRKTRQVIDVGGVYVNRKRVRMASRAVRAGDAVRVEYSEEGLRKLRAPDVGLKLEDVLYEDHAVVAINKPPGMPAQATRDQSILHAVACLQALDKERGVKGRKYVLVHRLDKDTSGVLLIADGNERATWLTERFRERDVDKTYLAVCHGLPADKRFTERSPLSEIDKKTGDVRAVRAGGRSAVTHFEVLGVNEELGVSFLRCKPETGRSHQIRVHLQINGLPIVGDKRYTDPNARARARAPWPPALSELTAVHHFLHARALQLEPAPGVGRVRVEAPLPPRMAEFLRLAGFVSP